LVQVESRSGAVATYAPLRFHSPLIKPDVRISRIRLPDQGDVMLSPTGSWVWWPPTAPVPTFRKGIRQDNGQFRHLGLYVSDTTTDAADNSNERPLRDRLCSQVQGKSTCPNP